MKVNLMDFYEHNQQIDREQSLIDEKKELRKILAHIITGEESCRINNINLIEKIGIKLSKSDKEYDLPFFIYSGIKKNSGSYGCYHIKLNKTNIKKIQDYIDKEENN